MHPNKAVRPGLRTKGKSMLFRKFQLSLLGATMAISVLTIGCQPQASTAPTTAQPAQDETVIYNKWEVETHRPHKDISQRPPEEQKEYQDWRQKQPNAH
jgi:hypothetical protein